MTAPAPASPAAAPFRAPPLKRYIGLSIATALVTIGIKFAAWGLSDSVSLLSDALEALVNLAAALIALWALWLAGLPADKEHAFGHAKAEYFSSAAEGGLIVLASISIFLAALARFQQPGSLADLEAGLALSFVAAACNLVTARVLIGAGRRHDSIVLEADGHHLMTDVWTSAGIGAGLVLVWINPDLAWLDPVMACAVALHILVIGVGLLWRSGQGLMDHALPETERLAIRNELAGALAGRGRLGPMRTRRAGRQRFFEMTVYLPPDMTVVSAHQICDELEARLDSRFQPRPQVVIHVEPDRREPAG